MIRLSSKQSHQRRKKSQHVERRSSPLVVTPLSEDELEAVLRELNGWSQQEGKLHRQFRFNSFEKALGFLSGLALIAERMKHHLEESNIYNRVTVDLTTEEVGGITNLDIELARKAEELAAHLNLSEKKFQT